MGRYTGASRPKVNQPLLGHNSKFCSDEDTLECIEVLHADFRDAPTNSKKMVSRAKPKYFLVLFTYSTLRE